MTKPTRILSNQFMVATNLMSQNHQGAKLCQEKLQTNQVRVVQGWPTFKRRESIRIDTMTNHLLKLLYFHK